jgi:acyl carrier protein
MDMDKFINKFADQFEDTERSLLTANTQFRNLEEWSSLIALSIIAMVDDEYGVVLTGDAIRKAQTIQELYDIIRSQMCK